MKFTYIYKQRQGLNGIVDVDSKLRLRGVFEMPYQIL